MGAVHVADAVGDCTAKGAGKGGRSENQRDPHRPFGRFIPERQIVDKAREEAGLHDAEQEAQPGYLGVVVSAAEAHRCRTPGNHEKGDPALRGIKFKRPYCDWLEGTYTGLQLLQKVIGWHFEHCVRNEKDHECDAAPISIPGRDQCRFLALT